MQLSRDEKVTLALALQVAIMEASQSKTLVGMALAGNAKALAERLHSETSLEDRKYMATFFEKLYQLEARGI